MAGYNSTSLALAEEQAAKDCFEEIETYLSADGGYWLDNDIWRVSSGKFAERGICPDKKKMDVIADFSTVPGERAKGELKYYALWSLSNSTIAVSTYSMNYKSAVQDIGKMLQARADVKSITELVLTDEELAAEGWAAFHRSTITYVLNRAKALLNDIYDIQDETEKDVWRALRIPGARLSAVQKRSKPSLRFSEIPGQYKEAVKRYFRRLVVKRSWSHCSEMLRYIRRFFRSIRNAAEKSEQNMPEGIFCSDASLWDAPITV